MTIRRQVTTVFQRPVLLRASVRANVAYGLGLRGEFGNGRVDEMLGRVGLDKLADMPAQKLSGGEMQRVALARALVVNPAVLLLDEPTANLDPYNVGLIEEIVALNNRERSTTVVLVTHNVFQAKRLAQPGGGQLSQEDRRAQAKWNSDEQCDEGGDQRAQNEGQRTEGLLKGRIPLDAGYKPQAKLRAGQGGILPELEANGQDQHKHEQSGQPQQELVEPVAMRPKVAHAFQRRGKR